MNNVILPQIIAHRGSSVEAFENTMEAFELAIKQKADMIELDTHLTKDGFFIVHHDGMIVSDGVSYKISETRLEELSDIRLPNKEKIPLLEEVLKNFLPQIKFNIEIKCSITKKDLDDFLEVIGLDTSRIMISSFLYPVLKELKSSKHSYSLAYLYIFPTITNNRRSKHSFLSAMNPFHKFLSSNKVVKYHSRKKQVFPWTINDKKTIEKFVRFGVDGIITDDPLNTRKIVDSLKD